MSVTMRDVARRAGVTPTTISHVINNTRYVRKETHARVWAAINELGYQPNNLARSLRRKETHTFGLIVPDNANPFFAEVARGIEDSSFDRGYCVILCNSEKNLEKELSYINVLQGRQVDGIILVSAGINTQHIIDLQEKGKPVVVVDREIAGVNVDAVLTDNRGGGYKAVHHLVELGHKRIGCISGPSELTPSAERVDGYKQAVTEAGLRWEPNLIIKGDFHSKGGYSAIEKLMSLPEPPTAVFACNDMMAIGAMAGAIDLGYNIPHDLSIVGFDDIELASYTNPKLTTVEQPKYKMGTVATEMMLRQVNEGKSPGRRLILPTELIIRQSTTQPT